MNTLLHMVCYDDTLSEFADSADLESFYKAYGCDGLEMIVAGNDSRGIIRPQTVTGLHLSFYSCWLDFWNGDTKRLMKEFGSREVAGSFYGGSDKNALLNHFRRDLKQAKALGVQYVVFHVSDVTLEETFTGHYYHTDEEVIDAAADLINELLDEQDYPFEFLMENLWYPGLRLTNPALTKRLLDQVHFPQKGIMLDIGHLLNTNPSLRTEEEAIAYLNKMLDDHGELCSTIRGIHLHGALSGEYVRQSQNNIPPLKKDYYERFAQSYNHVGNIDPHTPLPFNGTKELVERISPRYLVYEFLAGSRARQQAYLKQQSFLFSSATAQK